MLETLIKLTPEKGTSYKPKHPFLAKIKAISEISTTSGLDQTMHIVLDISGSGLQYAVGQSIGVIPPGKREDNRPLKARLYSIANCPPGEEKNTESIALTVKRSVWQNAEGQTEFGLCSNYLCNLKVGDEVPIISPSGRIMLPPQNPDTDLILIGTGTGVAPYRGFLQHIDRLSEKWQGKVLLILGYKNKAEALYCNQKNTDLLEIQKKYGFELSLALSREEKNTLGAKMYVADRVAEKQALISTIFLRNNPAIYLCGLKGMEAGIEENFTKICSEIGLNWERFKQDLIQAKRYNVEVY